MITELTSKGSLTLNNNLNSKDTLFACESPHASASHVYKHRTDKSMSIRVTFSLVDQRSRIKFDCMVCLKIHYGFFE